MNRLVYSLDEITVANAMQTEVATVSANATMVEAARVFVDHEVNGAPVVDEYGKCVGVVSTNDLAHWINSRQGWEASSRDDNDFALSPDDGAGPYVVENIPRDRVRFHMTAAPQTIDATLTLLDAARFMCGGAVHQLIVVDESIRPVGVVGSLDLVRAIVKLADTPS